MLTADEIRDWDSDPRIVRVREIDTRFEAATGWGSWMVSAANEREQLVEALRAAGHQIEHRHLARTASGGRVS